jgi:hypothetical protein
MKASFERLGTTGLLVALLLGQLAAPLAGLSQPVGLSGSAPAPVGTAAAPAPVRSVSRTPGALDLGSTDRSLTAAGLPGSGTANICVAGLNRSVTAGTLLTPAERLAVFQVISTGRQSLLLGTSGNAVGGRFTVGPNFSQYVSSLTVPAGVTAIDHLTTSSTLSLQGNLINAGTFFVVSSNPSLRTANIGAYNISNLAGALISSVLPETGLPGFKSAVTNLSLNLSAVNDFTNAGTIKSSGSLNISAGGSLANSLPSGVSTAVAPVLQSAGDLNLSSGSGRFVNSGVVASLAGNINIASQMNHKINFDNSAGKLIAEKGALNVGTSRDLERTDIFIHGGGLTAETLHLQGRELNVAVDELNGALNMTGSTAHVTASTPDLVLGEMNLSGDPTFYNTAGNVTIATPLSYSGQNLAIVASSNIVSAKGAGAINTSSSTGSAGAITLIAGAAFSTSGPSGLQGPDTTSTLTITGGSASGGYLDLTGGTGTGTAGTTAITGLTSKSTALNGSGGNITLAAFAGAGANTGAIVLPAALPITSGGKGTGSNGNVVILAGRTDSIAIKTGSINTTGGASGTGTITVKNATPTLAGVSVTNGALTGTFNAGAAQTGSVTTGALTAAGADVSLAGGSYTASGAIAGANVQITSGSSVKVTGTITGSTSASLQAAGSIPATSVSKISAPTVNVISSTGSIGAAGAPLKLAATNLTANAAASDQNVYISATALGLAPAKLNLLGSNSAGAGIGNFSLLCAGGVNINSGAYVAAGNSVLIAASGAGASIAQMDASGTTTIFSPSIKLAAGSAAGIGSASNILGVAASRSNASQTIALTATAAGGSVQIKAVDSLYPANLVNVGLSGSSSAGPTAGIFSLNATGDISLTAGAKVTDATGSIALVAGAGKSITQAVPGVVTLSSANVSLSADAAGVTGTLGTLATPLSLTAAKLSATAGGSVWLSNTVLMSSFTAVSRNGNVSVSDKAGVTLSGSSTSTQTFLLTAAGPVKFASGASVSANLAVNIQSTAGIVQTDAQTVNSIIAPTVTLGAGSAGLGKIGFALGVASQAANAPVVLTVTTKGAAFLSGNFPTGGNGSAAAGFNFTGASQATGAFNLACAGDIYVPDGVSLKSAATTLTASAGGTSPGAIRQQTLTAPAFLGAGVNLSAAGNVTAFLQNPASATAVVNLTASSGGEVTMKSSSPVVFKAISGAGANATTGFSLTVDGKISFLKGAQVTSAKSGTQVSLSNTKGTISQAAVGVSIIAPTVVLSSAEGIGTSGIPLGTSTVNLHASCATCSAYLMDAASVNLPAISVGPTSTYSLLMSGTNQDIVLASSLNAGTGGTIVLTNPTGGSILNPGALTIAAKTIKLSASAGIGSAAAPVLVSGCGAPSAVSSAGSVYLRSDTAISASVNIVAGAGKTVSVTTTGSNQDITLGAWSAKGGTMILNASGSILNPKSCTITAATIDLTAVNAIGASTPNVIVNAGVLSANSPSGNVYVKDTVSVQLLSSSAGSGKTFSLINTAGDIALCSNVNVGASGQVVLKAGTGKSITNSGAWVLTGSTINLAGSAGIGAAANPFRVSGCSALTAAASAGNLYLTSDVAISTAGMSFGAGKTLSLTTTGSGKDITIGANCGNLTGTIVLNASGSIVNPDSHKLTAGTIDLHGVNGIGNYSGPDIMINGCAKPTAVSSSGSVYLSSDTAITSIANISAAPGEDVWVTTTGSNRDITIDANYTNTGGYISLDASGSILSTGAYTLTASKVDLAARVSLGSQAHPLLAQSSTPGVDLDLSMTCGNPVAQTGGTGVIFVGIPAAGLTSTKTLPVNDFDADTQIDNVLVNDWDLWCGTTGGMLTVSEVGQLLVNPNITGSQAAVLGLIANMYTDNEDASAQAMPYSYSYVQNKLHNDYFGYYKQAMSQLDSSHNGDGSFKVYGSYSGPQFGSIRQGPLGDCYFLAAVNGVLDQNPTNISKIIALSGNNFTLTFANGVKKVVTLTDGEIASFSFAVDNGCWLAALGLAEAQIVLTGPNASKLTAVAKATPMGPAADGGYPTQSFGLLTGKQYSPINNGDDSLYNSEYFDQSDIRALLGYCAYNNLPMGVSAPGHSLTILNFSSYSESVTILNPWGTSGPYNTGLNSSPYMMTYGQFTISLSEMMEGFCAITVPTTALYADLSPYYYSRPPITGLSAASLANSSIATVASRAALPSLGTLNTSIPSMLSSTLSSLRNTALPASIASVSQLTPGGMPALPAIVTNLAPSLAGVAASQLRSAPVFSSSVVAAYASSPSKDVGPAQLKISCHNMLPGQTAGTGNGSEFVLSPTASSSRLHDSGGTGLDRLTIFDKTPALPGERSVVVREGCVLFAPDRDVCVDTPYAQVTIAAKAVALLVVSQKGVSVYNLHDLHSGDVSVLSGQCRHTVDLSRQITISPTRLAYEEVDPARSIAHADMEMATLPGGSRMFRSSFSLASALSALRPVLTAEHATAAGRRIERQLIKNAAIFMETRVAATPYRRSEDMR